MALHFADEHARRAGKLEGGGVVARADDKRAGEQFADFFIQGIDGLEIDGLVDIVVEMDEERMHQGFFDVVHERASWTVGFFRGLRGLHVTPSRRRL
jgi:hypothetical protein